MERIGGETVVLYADLRERLEISEALRSISSLPGQFTSKTVKGSTIAYQVLGTHLGVVWERASHMPQDADLEGDSRSIAIALPNLAEDVPIAIDSLQMGFFPVPRLSEKEPSTPYSVRGKTLRIDLYTPAKTGRTTPVFIRRLNALAAPQQYLDYLIEDPVHAVMIARTPCLVKVPQPARYALYKILISQERELVATAQMRKDLLQVKALIELLREDRPGDIDLARDALVQRVASLLTKLETTCGQVGIVL